MVLPHIRCAATAAEKPVVIPRMQFSSITILSLTETQAADLFNPMNKGRLKRGSKIAPLTMHLSTARLTIVEDHAYGEVSIADRAAENDTAEVTNKLHTLWLYQKAPGGGEDGFTTTKTTTFCERNCNCFSCCSNGNCKCSCPTCSLAACCKCFCDWLCCGCCDKTVSTYTAGTHVAQLLYYPVPLGLVQHAQFELDQSQKHHELVLSIRFVEPMTRDLSIMMLTMEVTRPDQVKDLLTFLGALSEVCPAMTPAGMCREAVEFSMPRPQPKSAESNQSSLPAGAKRGDVQDDTTDGEGMLQEMLLQDRGL